MHEGMSTKNKRVVVNCRDRRSSGSTNMGEDSLAGGVGTYTAEVCVMKRWLGVFEERRMLCSIATSVEVFGG